MAKPWKKQWPYITKSGAKSYRVGFRDHDGIARTKAFPTAKVANEWTEEYVSAERRGSHSLRRFLLDLDAKDASGDVNGRTIGEVIQLYFAFNAPETSDGLATSTFHSYRHSANRHLLGMPGTDRGKKLAPANYAVCFAGQSVAQFNEPAAPRALREAMKHAKAGPSARAHAWRVLSAVLSWAANSELVPEIESNGCLFANEKISNRRKSMRGVHGRATSRRRGEEVRSWALSPIAVERIRAEMLDRAIHTQRPILAYRDAMILSIQFGLALRNQEVYGLRWSSLQGNGRARITEVLSWNQLDDWGKTARATGRITKVPTLLDQDLNEWRSLLGWFGYRTGDIDFVIPGDLAGPKYGIRDPDTGACHMSSSQAGRWRPRYLKPAAAAVANSQQDLVYMQGATPYGLRRGGISARLRSEDAQSVADQCGTSLEMLSRHYSYEIDDFGITERGSFDQEWRQARTAMLFS
jgi:integrase